MKKVLLTGASGFIARNSIAELIARGYEVHGACLPGEETGDWAVPGAIPHPTNLLLPEARRDLLNEVQASHLLHFAWYAVPGKYWSGLENLEWVGASLDLLVRFAEHGGKRAVFAGTCAEYDWSHEEYAETTTPVAPNTLYGICKSATHRIAAEAARQLGISIGWGRIFFLYGPHEAKARLIPSVITALLEGRPALCGHGRQVRDFMHVEDVGRAFVAVLESDWEGPINIASGRSASIAEIVQRIGEIAGRPDLIELGARPAAPDEPERMIPNVDSLTRRVGFTPAYTLEEGLEATVSWWREHLDR